jgi:hypothetical protein
MSTTNIKYIQLLQQIANNPLRPKVAAAVDIVADFEKDMEAIGLDRRLSVEGKRDKAQGNLKKALRDLRDTRKTALDEHHAATETLRAKVKAPAFDPKDVVGALLRKEVRDASRAMTAGQRAAKLAGPTRSKAFIDAVLEFDEDPWMSGVNVFDPGEVAIFEEAKAERLRSLFGPLLDQIAERDGVESQAKMILDVARADLKLHSGMDDRVFADFAKQVDSGTGAQWLKRDKDANGNEVIYVLVPEGGGFRGQIADAETVRNGHFFKDYEEYQAARAA